MKRHTIICFDRDQTLDINPPKDKRAVPLSWVQYFAHKTDEDIDVWATGNAQLQIEAGIPTPYEAKKILFDNNYSVNKSLTFRRDGLDIIERLYNELYDNPKFIVVDDENLSNYTNNQDWYWYKPNEFFIDINNVVEEHSIPNPQQNNMTGKPYYETDKYGTYSSLMDRINRNID